jgi:hypothetical protein
VFQVVCDLFLRPSDGGGDFLCRKGTFLQKGAELMPYGLRFPRYLEGRPCVFARGFVSHDDPILSKRNRLRDIRLIPHGKEAEIEELPAGALDHGPWRRSANV